MYNITEINSVFTEEFDIVFESSYPYMEAGTFKWEDLGSFFTKQEKKKAVQEKCQTLLDSGCRGLYWEENGVPLHVAIGYPVVEEKNYYLHWVYSFLGKNSLNSKSYIYSDTYIQETKKFFQKELKLDGYKITCVKNKGVHLHHSSKSRNAFYSVSEVELENGFCELTFLYT